VFFIKIITVLFSTLIAFSCGKGKGAEPLVESSSSFESTSLSSEFTENLSSLLTESSSSSLLLRDSFSSIWIESSSSVTPLSSSSLGPQQSSSSLAQQPSSSSISASSVYKSGDYILGADISKFQEYESRGALFYDVDGIQKPPFAILKNHGFNYARLKTFVDPAARYGYAAAGCGETSTEAFGDKTHVVAYAKKIKDAGMAFLLDIHYSDNWADPGKQIIPERWRSITSIDVLADSIYAYTYDLLMALKNNGALPEMVQVGNEITNGMLRDLPTASTNCWGANTTPAPASISGQLSTQPNNFGKMLKAGLRAVHDVSPNIITVMHIESAVANGSWWLREVVGKQKIEFDVLAFSAYTAYSHGVASDWKKFIQTESAKYPKIKFLLAEYNGGVAANTLSPGVSKEINLMLKGTPKALGSFYWEPALNGEWGGAIFKWSGNKLNAISSAFSEFDEILPALGLTRH